jgi:hypothetical protein
LGLKEKKGFMLRMVVFLISRRHYEAGRASGSDAYDFRKSVFDFRMAGGMRARGAGVEYVYNYLRAGGW